MGVTYLLTLLRYACERVNIPKAFDGQTLYVDGFVWLHELVAHHAREVVILKNLTPVVNEFVWRCLQHLQSGRRVLIVLDGMRHTSKYATNEARHLRRVKALMEVELALDEDEEGLTIDPTALRLSAAVSEDLVNALIDALRNHGIAYLRAPYEADGQLAYCALQHPDASIVWTCDSDLQNWFAAS